MPESDLETSKYPRLITTQVKRWPSERPLYYLILSLSIAIWLVLVLSAIGFTYVLIIGLIIFFIHLAFIARLRGSALRLTPEQMPDLFYRVLDLSRQMGFSVMPAAYVMQAGGVLNALATSFLSSNFIVLYSDLLDACGENTEARDMIIAHELGHLRAGHLRWRWFLLPGLFVPFLGAAYSRACEYTSDRYGVAVCRNREAGLRGLAILAAGGKLGPDVNLRALVKQREDVTTPWMMLGRWMATHPPIAHRIATLEPSLAEGKLGETRSILGALGLLVGIYALMVITYAYLYIAVWPVVQTRFKLPRQLASARWARQLQPTSPLAQVRIDLLGLAQVASEERSQSHQPPVNAQALYDAWKKRRPGISPPTDPFTSGLYGYGTDGRRFYIWSTGPNPNDSRDDIIYTSDAGGG